jgi:hypothetical protein
VVDGTGPRVAGHTRTRATLLPVVYPFTVSDGVCSEGTPRTFRYGGGGGTEPTPSNPPAQPSPSEQPSILSEQPSIPTIPPIIPVTDDMDGLPPLVAREDIDSDSDDEDEGNGVSVNPRPTQFRTRSGRNVRPPNIMNLNAMKVKELKAHKSNNAKELRKKLASQKVRSGVLKHQFISSVKWTHFKNCMLTGQLGKLLGNLHQETDHDIDTVEHLDPSIFAANANSEDTPTYEESMNDPFADEFKKAMWIEWDMLNVVMKAWEIVDRQPWMKVLPSTWALRCNRFPDGLIRKLKARFCARGDKHMEGVDFFETFAPVCNWQTVRIMLIVSLIYDFATLQVDYTAALTQSDIDKPPNWDSMTEEQKESSGVYLELPKGFKQPGKVLRLKKSIYGLRQSPRNWFLHLKEKFAKVGFKQSEYDACLFVSDRVICSVYVDDTLFFSPRQEYTDEMIVKLEASGLSLEAEDDIAGFLGVLIESRGDGTILMTQPGLTERIVKALKSNHLSHKRTPAKHGALGKDEGGEAAHGEYSYPSVIGMIGYLQGHSRSDTTFATSQCARFIHCTKRSREEALERIGQYLKATGDKGLILHPKNHKGRLDIDCYVDADFAGL